MTTRVHTGLHDRNDEEAVTRDSFGHEIYLDDVTFECAGKVMCPECFQAYLDELYRTSPWLLADALGFEIVRHV